MTTSLETIFSEDHMLAYSRACLDLAVEIPESCKKHGFDTLVIPSRGAVPFFLGGLYALDRISREWQGEYQDFYEDLGVQPMLTSLLPPNSRVANTTYGKKARVLLVPFTADLNVEKFDPSQSNDDYTSDTRFYWANVTASFFKPTEERKADPYFKSFVDVILRYVEGRNHHAEIYEAFPAIKRFAMIDTVISGRASNDILSSFDFLASLQGERALMPWTFLIVDENGQKLRPDFARYLEQKKRDGQVITHEVPRIVSEDEGASLLGVSAVMYPSVMRASKKLVVNGKREFFVGAGSWFLGSDLETDSNCTENFRMFMDLVYSGINVEYSKAFGDGVDEKDLERFRRLRQDYLNYAGSTKMFTKTPNVAALKLDKRFVIESPYQTGSFVLHVPFSDKTTQKILEELKSIPSVSVRTRTD